MNLPNLEIILFARKEQKFREIENGSTITPIIKY